MEAASFIPCYQPAEPNFLSNAFVITFQKVDEGHYWTGTCVNGVQNVLNGFLNKRRAVHKGQQGPASICKLQIRAGSSPAGAQMPLARDHFTNSGYLLQGLAVVFFFFLGFKLCCMVWRVANACNLIIDLRRLCYLQLVQWTTTWFDLDSQKDELEKAFSFLSCQPEHF